MTRRDPRVDQLTARRGARHSVHSTVVIHKQRRAVKKKKARQRTRPDGGGDTFVPDDGATVLRYRKPTFARPAPIDLRHEIAVQCEVVIEALAD